MIDYLLLAFYIIVAIQSIYYILFISPLLRNKKTNNRNSLPISVIICAKNEANNIKEFLPKILNQRYKGEFEVVFINDRSTDDTAEIIHSFKTNYSNLKIVTIEDCENFWGNKKYALTLGIKAASYEHLLFTDADCYPNSEQWIAQMASSFSAQKNIVLGYGAYRKESNSFLNKIIRFETLITAVQYFSYAKLGSPYMGVGRNLAYTKTEFFNVKGFIKHIKIKSGDDDLFINEAASSRNTSINLNGDSFTTSLPKLNFKDWIIQKRRHISTSTHYKLKHKLLLSLFYFTQILFFLLSTSLLILGTNTLFVLMLISIRYVAFYISIGIFSKKLKEQDLLLFFPILEMVLIFLQLFIYLKNKVSTPVIWN